MEIIFVILKIIGILLAILLLLCITLFVVPVRYRVNITVQEGAEGKAAIHWLLHLVDVRIYYKEKKVSYKLRIFGIPVPLGKEKNGGQKGIKKGKKEKTSSGKQGDAEGVVSEEVPSEPGGSPEKEDALGEANSPEHRVSLEKKDTTDTSQGQSSSQNDTSEKGRAPARNGYLSKEGESNGTGTPNSSKKFRKKKKKRKKKGNTGFFDKIKSKFKNIKNKSRAMSQNLQQREEGIKGGASSLKGQLRRIRDMVSEETNQAAFLHVLQEIRYLLRHYIPGTVSGNLTFSMGNPELTGKALGSLSLLPFWARSRMVVMPDFLSETFYAKGILYVAGHIRFLHLPLLGIRLLADKNIRKLIKDIRSQL